jgi:hypothetical protein
MEFSRFRDLRIPSFPDDLRKESTNICAMHNICASRHNFGFLVWAGSILRASQSWIFYGVEVADVEESSVGAIEGAVASTMTVLVLVDVTPLRSVATY